MKIISKISLLLFAIIICSMRASASDLTLAGGYPQSFSGVTASYDNIIFRPGGILNLDAGCDFTVAANITIDNKARMSINASKLTCSSSSGYILVNAGGTLNIFNASTINFDGIHIIVNTGGTLVVNGSTINMGNNLGRISVLSDYLYTGSSPDPGGILNVVNSTIQGAGGWQGIEIMGGNGANDGGFVSNYLSQRPCGIKKVVYVAQGIITGSTIKNMARGITNYNRYVGMGASFPPISWYGGGGSINDNGFNSGGGIVQVDHCSFSNNQKTFQFEDYQNWMNIPAYTTSFNNYTIGTSKLLADESFIRNSSFTGSAYDYVYMEGVQGVSILGCNFNGSYSVSNSAIELLNASITVDQACNDPYIPGHVYTSGCTKIAGSSLTRMRQGIVAASAPAAKGPGAAMITGNTIQNTTFGDMTLVGLSLYNYQNSIILNNTMSLNPSGSTPATGIALQNCTGYWAEGNSIVPDISGSGTRVGLVVNESQNNTNQIYRNTISDMTYAMQANGLNYDNSPTGDVRNGLRLLCNNMSTNIYGGEYDVVVGDIPPTTGAPTTATGVAGYQGNGTPIAKASAGNKFFSGATSNYWNQTGANPVTYEYTNLTDKPSITHGVTIELSSGTGCPVNTTCCGVAYPVNYPAPGSIPYHLFMLKKGNLETTINHHNGSFVSAMDQYGKTADSAIKGYLYLADSLHQYKGDSSFIQYTVDSLYDSSNSQYLLTTVMTYLDSPVVVNFDTVMQIMDSTKYFSQYKINLAGMYAQQGDFTKAFNILDSIQYKYSLDSSSLRSLNNIIYLTAIEDSLYRFGGKYDSLGSYDTSHLRHLATDSSGQARYIAQAIIMGYDGDNFVPDIYIPQVGQKQGNDNASISSIDAEVILSPNPVQDNLHITVQSSRDEITASVCDVTGREVIRKEWQGQKGATIAMNGLANGTYLVKITLNGKNEYVYKIVKE